MSYHELQTALYEHKKKFANEYKKLSKAKISKEHIKTLLNMKLKEATADAKNNSDEKNSISWEDFMTETKLNRSQRVKRRVPHYDHLDPIEQKVLDFYSEVSHQKNKRLFFKSHLMNAFKIALNAAYNKAGSTEEFKKISKDFFKQIFALVDDHNEYKKEEYDFKWDKTKRELLKINELIKYFKNDLVISPQKENNKNNKEGKKTLDNTDNNNFFQYIFNTNRFKTKKLDLEAKLENLLVNSNKKEFFSNDKAMNNDINKSIFSFKITNDGNKNDEKNKKRIKRKIHKELTDLKIKSAGFSLGDDFLMSGPSKKLFIDQRWRTWSIFAAIQIGIYYFCCHLSILNCCIFALQRICNIFLCSKLCCWNLLRCKPRDVEAESAHYFFSFFNVDIKGHLGDVKELFKSITPRDFPRIMGRSLLSELEPYEQDNAVIKTSRSKIQKEIHKLENKYIEREAMEEENERMQEQMSLLETEVTVSNKRIGKKEIAKEKEKARKLKKVQKNLMAKFKGENELKDHGLENDEDVYERLNKKVLQIS